MNGKKNGGLTCDLEEGHVRQYVGRQAHHARVVVEEQSEVLARR
jgi:hypothetical protein